MKSLIIYDSVYGNTEKVAQAIGKSLKSKGNVRVISIKDARVEELKVLDLRVVGSPTQAFNPLPAVTHWLKALSKGSLAGIRVAAFDTRMDIKKIDNKFLTFMTGINGYAAKKIADLLVKKGGKFAADPGGFIVEESEGPLRTGELERAAAWAMKLV
ncbi:MAG: flavodoxin family protein [Anaerolineaceae bacterium]